MLRIVSVRCAVMVVAGLGLAACAGLRQPVAPPAISTASPAPSAGAVTPAFVAPTAAPTATDLNRRLLAQTTPDGDESDLPLGAGDLIEVSVFEVPELSALKMRVPHSGSITLPLIGSVAAAGVSAQELQNGIRAKLQEKYMHDPQVTVFVHEHKSQRVSVMGAVRTGGVYSLSSRFRLADALAMAGGLTEEAGHVIFVIRRAGGEEAMVAVDLEQLAGGKEELNLALKSGDVIEVPRAGSFYVGGEVQKPGSFLLKARTTLDQAVTAAAGPRDVADRDDVRLYRIGPDGKPQIFEYSLNKLEEGQLAPEVKQNDVIIVGKSLPKAVLYGFLDFIRFGLSVPLQ